MVVCSEVPAGDLGVAQRPHDGSHPAAVRKGLYLLLREEADADLGGVSETPHPWYRLWLPEASGPHVPPTKCLLCATRRGHEHVASSLGPSRAELRHGEAEWDLEVKKDSQGYLETASTLSWVMSSL